MPISKLVERLPIVTPEVGGAEQTNQENYETDTCNDCNQIQSYLQWFSRFQEEFGGVMADRIETPH